MLGRLLEDPGVSDFLDLAVLCDEELQKAGLSPIQLKRFAVLQHKMNAPNPSQSIIQLSMKQEDIIRECQGTCDNAGTELPAAADVWRICHFD